jgi:hypothetical protein
VPNGAPPPVPSTLPVWGQPPAGFTGMPPGMPGAPPPFPPPRKTRTGLIIGLSVGGAVLLVVLGVCGLFSLGVLGAAGDLAEQADAIESLDEGDCARLTGNGDTPADEQWTSTDQVLEPSQCVPGALKVDKRLVGTRPLTECPQQTEYGYQYDYGGTQLTFCLSKL